MKSLNLWWPRQGWGTGWGDYIQIASIIPEWQYENPGSPVVIAYQPTANSAAMLNVPGVEYIITDEPPDESFLHVFDASPYPPRSLLWERLGLNWERKRYHYWPTQHEIAYGETVWMHAPRPRIIVQITGGMMSKTLPWRFWEFVADELAKVGSIIILDGRGTYLGKHRTVGRMPDPRMAMGIVATADLYVGWDSGPFYVALGTNTPAVGLFTVFPPEGLYWPVLEPSSIPLVGPLDLIRPEHIIGAATDLISGAGTFDKS